MKIIDRIFIGCLAFMSEINPYKLKISQLRALVGVADYGNFSEAALQMDLSQSAISHAIASLESELGVILLSRGRHGATLTPVGERVIPQAREVLHLLEAMVKEANLAKGLHGVNIRIASFRSVATHILPSAIARFRHSFPEIAVTILEHFDHESVEQALRHGLADIGFIYIPSSSEFETWEILRDEYVVLLPPNPKLKNSNLTWEQLAAYSLILPSQNDSCFIRVRNHALTFDAPLKVAYEVNEDSTIVSMVVQGLGAAILPRLAAEPIPEEIQVCSLPVPLERVIGVAVLANILQTPAVFAFLDTLKNVDQLSIKTAV